LVDRAVRAGGGVIAGVIVGVIAGVIARFLPSVTLAIIGRVAEALENLAVGAIGLRANFLAGDLGAARVG